MNEMAIQPVGYTEETPDGFILGDGAFFAEVDAIADRTTKPTYDEVITIMENASSAGKAFGGTRDNATFTFTTTKEQVPVNDMKNPIPGTQVITAQEARLTGTMIDLKIANIERVIPTSYIDPVDEGLTATSVILQSHYLKNIMHVSMYGNGDLCVIRLDNALQTGDVTINFGQGVNTATLPFNYLGHVSGIKNAQFAPFKVWRVPMPTGGAGVAQQAIAQARGEVAETEKATKANSKYAPGEAEK